MSRFRRRGWLWLARQYRPTSALYAELSKRPRNPVARQLIRQIRSRRRLRVLTVSLLWTLPVLCAAAFTYSRVGVGLAWSLPLWLMLLSLFPSALWMTRVVAVLSRLSKARALEELSLIPEGRRSLHITVCQLVLSENDAAYWLALLRRAVMGMALLMLALALCIAFSQVGALDAGELSALLLDILLIALSIPLEGAQSAVIACLLGVRFGTSAFGAVEPASAALAAFVLLQALSFALAVAGAILLQAPRPWLVFGLFLLSRELAIALLWRKILPDD